ncbi:MAG: 16S rRNA (uracil(1498)-N(3))-methyltransferase [Acidobacteriota bacterium]
MQRRRFYASPDAINDRRITLSGDESHHLLRVLRLQAGDEVFVFDGCGQEYRCQFVEAKSKLAVVEIGEALTDVVESPLAITLAQALVKGEKFDLIVQKATELGVSRIVPLATARADMKLNAEQANKRQDRWHRIALEALKQSGRRTLVAIEKPSAIDKFIATHDSESQGEIIFFNERGGALLDQTMSELINKDAVTVMIGPEGGWGDDEIDCFNQCGAKAVTLGRRILRSETAALVAVTLLQHRLGDLSR